MFLGVLTAFGESKSGTSEDEDRSFPSDPQLFRRKKRKMEKDWKSPGKRRVESTKCFQKILAYSQGSFRSTRMRRAEGVELLREPRDRNGLLIQSNHPGFTY